MSLNIMKSKKACFQLATAIALPLAAVIGGSIPAQAVTFNITFAPGTTQQQIVGVKMAADIWSRHLVDNTTVNLYVGMSNQGLGTGAIAGATPGLLSNMNYTNYYISLKADKTSTLDNSAVASLSASSAYNFKINGTPYSNNLLIATTANAKAVGINATGTTTQYGSLDGYVQFDPNRAWSYDYSRSGSILSTQYDFLSTAIHEIGHILGFVSSVDQPLDPTSNILRATPLDL
jgi:hypothetical protein